VSARPLPAGTADKLPAGAYYLLAGRSLSSLNVWEVGPDGALTQLTHNPPGHGVDALAASGAGIIVGDAAGGTDRLARWTRHGLSWLRHSYHGPFIYGSSPDISDHGTIGYVTPPTGSGAHADANFAIWTQPTFTSRATVVYRQRRPLDGPVFGPHGQIAIEGWTGPQHSRRPGVLIYHHGAVTTLTTGVPAIPSLLAWGHRAPALAVAFPANRAELLFPDGRRQPLPRGWPPLACRPLPPGGCARSASSRPRCKFSRRSGWPARRRCDRRPGRPWIKSRLPGRNAADGGLAAR
jgi:hypothetical protein